MLVLGSRRCPLAAAYAVARGDRLAGLARALDPSALAPADRRQGSCWRRFLPRRWSPRMHVALGLVFDPRYKDFPFAALPAR